MSPDSPIASGAFTPAQSSGNRNSHEAQQPHLKGLSASRWIRRAFFTLFIVHIIFLLFWTGPGRAPISNLLQLFIGLGATAICFYNSRFVPGRNRFWTLTGASFLLWNASLAVAIVYENVLHATITSWWPSDLLFFVAPAPFLLVADDDAEIRRIGFMDVLHVVTVAVAVYLCFIFIPWKSLGDSVEFGLREWKVFIIRDAVLFLLLLVRFWRDREWPSSGAVMAYLLASGAGEGVYLYYQAQNILHSGTLADLVWTVPFALAVLISGREDRRQPAPDHRLKGTLFYGAVALHAVLMVGMLFSISSFSAAQLRVAQAGLALSFLLFAARMVRVHRVLAGIVEEVQSLNQGLETRVQERTGQLQAANYDLQRQNAEISRLVELKNRFMASVSHEFRTPLNAVVGFSSLLLENNGHDAGKQRQYLEHVSKSAADLSRLLNDVLDYADLDAGDVRLSFTAVNLKDLCREVVTGMGPVLHEKQLSVACQVAEVHVMADETRLGQVVQNLISTAIQFTPPHGTIRVMADERSGQAEVRIHDDGRGIPPERMEEVFGEFSQFGPDRERQISGPGLRLALARRLVEMHGGHIHVESGRGEGASFIFTIPTAPAA